MRKNDGKSDTPKRIGPRRKGERWLLNQNVLKLCLINNLAKNEVSRFHVETFGCQNPSLSFFFFPSPPVICARKRKIGKDW